MIKLKRRFGKSIVVSFLCVLCLSAFVPLLSHPLSLPLMNRPTDNKSTATTSKGQSFASENGFLAPLNAPIPMTNYTINAYLQHSSQIVNGITSINYVNHADIALDEIYFRIYPNAFRPHGWLDITEVYHQGSLLSYFVTGVDQTILIVDLVAGSGPGAVVPGANVTLVIYWQVKVPERNDRFGWSNSSDPDFLAYNMGNWHPIVAVFDERGWHTSPYTHMGESFYSDVATYNVYITVPDNFIIAATGQLAAISVGSGVKTWQFQTEPVRDFTWCASPNYQTASILTNGVNVTSYFIADHFAGGQRVLEVAEECLTIFGGYFGLYAWDNLHIVETDFWAGGMEYPQLIMIGSSLYGAPEGLSYLAIVTAHEMGHEWIPFSFGTDSYTEPWIDEGFASFVEYIWVESIYGTTDQEEYRLGDFDRYWTYVAEERGVYYIKH